LRKIRSWLALIFAKDLVKGSPTFISVEEETPPPPPPPPPPAVGKKEIKTAPKPTNLKSYLI